MTKTLKNHHRPDSRRTNRRGMSLLEVTIGSMMVATITIMASSVAVDMSRHMVGNIQRTTVLSEARLAIESFRRDLGGCSPDDRLGDRSNWRLVGRLIPSADELRLCYDSGQDASADWVAPDRVVIYTLDEDRLIRTDQLTGNTFTVARHVDAINFDAGGGEIEIQLDFEFGDFADTYVFVTADI